MQDRLSKFKDVPQSYVLEVGQSAVFSFTCETERGRQKGEFVLPG